MNELLEQMLASAAQGLREARFGDDVIGGLQIARRNVRDLEALAHRIEQVRSGAMPLAEFCDCYGLVPPVGGERMLAAALDAFNRHEHLGRTEAMRAALEAAE